jgi:hypothetical protein
MDQRVKPGGDEVGEARTIFCFVIAGLDPAIHAEKRLAYLLHDFASPER